MIKRERYQPHEQPLCERLTEEAKQMREQARLLPAGKVRSELLRKARQHEVAANIDRWISSPGLKPPKL